MAQTLEERTASTTAGTGKMDPPAGSGGWSWRKLVARSALGSALALLAVTALVLKAVVPPVAAMVLLLGAGGVLAGRSGRKGVTGVSLAAAGAALFVGVGGGFVLGVLGAPEEPREFIPVVAGFVLALVTLGASIVVAVQGRGRGFDPSRPAGVAAALTVALLGAVSVWSLYSGATFESAAAAAGDVRIEASEFTFTPAEIAIEAGRVGVHIENTGQGLHTFTVAELGVDVAVPAGKSQRAEFDAAAGQYRFVCKLHPGMEGVLNVG